MVSTYPPIKGTAFTAVFPILDADGDLVTGAAGLDSEVSKDLGTFTDCTNEATELATSSGMYYLTLTATEMTADTVAIIVKTSTSGAKTTSLVFYTSAQSLDTVDTNVDSIVAKLPTNYIMGSTVLTAKDDEIDAIKTITDALPSSVWSVATRALTDKAGFSISGTKTTLDALNDITAASVWSVVTRALTDKTGFSLAADQSAVTVGTVTTLTTWDKTGYALSATGIDSIVDEVMEGTLTLRQAIRLMTSMMASKSSGGGTATLVYRDFGDTKARLTFTADADGNRTAVVADAT